MKHLMRRSTYLDLLSAASFEERNKSMSAEHQAKINLARVVEAVGARLIDRVSYELKVQGWTFIVAPSTIIRMPRGMRRGQSCLTLCTCYRPREYEDLPLHHEEVMASALLLLKHDPRIFLRWRKDRDRYYA
jgi:hypothetical protein